MKRGILFAGLCFLCSYAYAQRVTFKSNIIAVDSISKEPLDSVTAIITFYYLKGGEEKKTIVFNEEYSFTARNCEFGIELKKDGYETSSYTTVEKSTRHFRKRYTFTCLMKRKSGVRLVEVK